MEIACNGKESVIIQLNFLHIFEKVAENELLCVWGNMIDGDSEEEKASGLINLMKKRTIFIYIASPFSPSWLRGSRTYFGLHLELHVMHMWPL